MADPRRIVVIVVVQIGRALATGRQVHWHVVALEIVQIEVEIEIDDIGRSNVLGDVFIGGIFTVAFIVPFDVRRTFLAPRWAFSLTSTTAAAALGVAFFATSVVDSARSVARGTGVVGSSGGQFAFSLVGRDRRRKLAAAAPPYFVAGVAWFRATWFRATGFGATGSGIAWVDVAGIDIPRVDIAGLCTRRRDIARAASSATRPPSPRASLARAAVAGIDIAGINVPRVDVAGIDNARIV